MSVWPQVALSGLIGFLVLLVAVYCVRILALTAWRRLTGRDRFTRPWLDRPMVRGAILVTGLVGTGCFLYAWQVEPMRLAVTHETVQTRRLGAGEIIRVVQLSDLHIDEDGSPLAGSRMALGKAPGPEGKRTMSTADLVDAENPDLVVLTGDYLNTHTPEAETTLRLLLTSLHPPFGIYAVPGNWDYRSWSRAQGILSQAGVHVLTASSEEIEIRGARVLLMNGDVPPDSAVVEDTSGAESGGGTARPEGGRPLRIYLAHSPDSIEDVAGRVDIYFCGHTHGGQVRLPLFGALITLSRFWKRYEMGRYEVNGTTLFVNRGIGSEGGPVPRVRFLSPPEILSVQITGVGP